MSDTGEVAAFDVSEGRILDDKRKGKTGTFSKRASCGSQSVDALAEDGLMSVDMIRSLSVYCPLPACRKRDDWYSIIGSRLWGRGYADTYDVRLLRSGDGVGRDGPTLPYQEVGWWSCMGRLSSACSTIA